MQSVEPDLFAKSDYKMLNPLTATVQLTENVNDILLARLEINGNTLFALTDSKICDKTVSFVFDWKKLYFTVDKDNDEDSTKQTVTVFHALLSANVLPCMLIKERVAGVLKNDYNFALDFDGKAIFVTEYVKTKLFKAAGRKVFNVALDADFDIYNALLLDSSPALSQDSTVPIVTNRNSLIGIPVIVDEVLDYSVEKVAKCSVDGTPIYVSIRENTPNLVVGNTLYLSINLPAIGITERDRGIRIV